MNLAEFDMTMFLMGFVKTKEIHRETYSKDHVSVYRYPGVNRLEIRNWSTGTPIKTESTREFKSALEYVNVALCPCSSVG